jgi:hypothetical protein
VARVARGRVIRPIRIFGALAIAGAGAAIAAFGGAPVPRAFLSMTAAIALAFAVNRRPISRPRYPAVRRIGWIAAAALMLAALPPPKGRGAGGLGFAITLTDLAVIAAVAATLIGASIRSVRGMRADPGDRLLVGVVGGIVAFAALFILDVPLPHSAWLYPFAIAVGSAVARANGNLARP